MGKGKNKNKKKFWRKRNFHKKKDEKDKSCPMGKKKCRCCLCQEEGHYANECPKKKNSEKTQVLKLAYNLGYEPIEDSDMDQEADNIYVFSSDSESEDVENSE